MPSVHAILVLASAFAAGSTLEPPADESTPACCQPGDARTAAILAAAQATEETKRSEADLPPEALAVLDAIDRQTLALENFASNVRMDSYDDLADETERRFGRVYLRMPGAGGNPPRAAAVVFERTIEPSGRARERLEHFVYAEGVLADYDHEAKRLVRRRLVEAGDDRDPLRLGEGPVPIPIAQRKADILAAFEVSNAPIVPDRLLREKAGVRGLHLVPRAGTRMARDGRISSIDLWVQGDAATPVAVEIHERDGDRVAMRFMKPRLNQGLDESAARWLVPPPVDAATWRIEES